MVNYPFLISFAQVVMYIVKLYQRLRDAIYMIFMKIVQFLKPHTPLSICVQNSSTSLILDIPFQTKSLPLSSCEETK